METLKLCVSCKGCRHDCPTGVDMAKMKIEVWPHARQKHGLSLRDRLVGYLPLCRFGGAPRPLANWRNSPLLRRLPKFAGISARALPAFNLTHLNPAPRPSEPIDSREVVLFADTFNRCYERETSTPRSAC